MKLALISDANSAGPFRQAIHPARWRSNGVEALAWIAGGDVFHGLESDGIVTDLLTGYDVVIVNLKRTLCPIVPGLVRALAGGPLVVGYQEDATDLAGRLSGPALWAYLAAHRAVSRLLVYDDRAVPVFEALTGGDVRHVPLPAPLADYEARRVARPHNSPHHRIAIGQTLASCRGALLSVCAAAKARPGAEIVAYASDASEAGQLSRIIAEAGCLPDVIGWTPWQRAEKPDFLGRLATCDAAVILDTASCYGRVVVDCAGLGVPCVGARRLFAQRQLYPRLAVEDYADAPAQLARALDPKSGARLVRDAGRYLRDRLGPDAVRALFEEALQ